MKASSAARVDFDQFGRPVVNITFDAQGAEKFANITRDYAPGGARPNPQDRRQLGIVLDGTLALLAQHQRSHLRRLGPDRGQLLRRQGQGIWPSCCAPVRCPPP